MSLAVAAIIWSFVLFDTLGDAVGAVDASWVVVVMSIFPVLMFVRAERLERDDMGKAELRKSEEKSIKEIEMIVRNADHVENPFQS